MNQIFILTCISGGVEVDECLDLVVRAHAFNKETIVGEVIIYYFSEFF